MRGRKPPRYDPGQIAAAMAALARLGAWHTLERGPLGTPMLTFECPLTRAESDYAPDVPSLFFLNAGSATIFLMLVFLRII